MNKIYPDNEYGAIQCLTILSSLPMDSVIAIPDPVVEGVWKITWIEKIYIDVMAVGEKFLF